MGLILRLVEGFGVQFGQAKFETCTVRLLETCSRRGHSEALLCLPGGMTPSPALKPGLTSRPHVALTTPVQATGIEALLVCQKRHRPIRGPRWTVLGLETWAWLCTPAQAMEH